MFINSRENLMLYFKLKPHSASAAWEERDLVESHTENCTALFASSNLFQLFFY